MLINVITLVFYRIVVFFHPLEQPSSWVLCHSIPIDRIDTLSILEYLFELVVIDVIYVKFVYAAFQKNLLQRGSWCESLV